MMGVVAESFGIIHKGCRTKNTLPLITIMATAVVISFTDSSDGEIDTQSTWADSTVVVDGNPDDWVGFPMV